MRNVTTSNHVVAERKTYFGCDLPSLQLARRTILNFWTDIIAARHLVVKFIMTVLCNRAGRYIFVLWLLLSSFFLSFFFLSFFLAFCPFFLSLIFLRLFSAIGNWMATIFPHMVWP